jgi:hypothetical protein
VVHSNHVPHFVRKDVKGEEAIVSGVDLIAVGKFGGCWVHVEAEATGVFSAVSASVNVRKSTTCRATEENLASGESLVIGIVRTKISEQQRRTFRI